MPYFHDNIADLILCLKSFIILTSLAFWRGCEWKGLFPPKLHHALSQYFFSKVCPKLNNKHLFSWFLFYRSVLFYYNCFYFSKQHLCMDMVETFHAMSKILQIFPKAALLILLNISLIKYCTQFIQLITNNLKRKINQHKYLS